MNVTSKIWWPTAGGAVAMLGGATLFWFDPSRVHIYPVCFFHQVTGLLCPGCGSLRALHQLFHGHLATAFRFNPLLVVSLPFAGWVAGQYARRRMHQQPASLPVRPVWVWVFLALALVFFVWRNLPGFPFGTLPE